MFTDLEQGQGWHFSCFLHRYILVCCFADRHNQEQPLQETIMVAKQVVVQSKLISNVDGTRHSCSSPPSKPLTRRHLLPVLDAVLCPSCPNFWWTWPSVWTSRRLLFDQQGHVEALTTMPGTICLLHHPLKIKRLLQGASAHACHPEPASPPKNQHMHVCITQNAEVSWT